MRNVCLVVGLLLVGLVAGCSGMAYEHATTVAAAPAGGALAPPPPPGEAPPGLQASLGLLEDARLAAAQPARPEPADPGSGGVAQPSPTATVDTATSAPPPEPTGPVTKRASPMLIYRAVFNLAVFETVKGIDTVQALAVELGGYLVRRDDRSIVVRVPADKYRGALEKIGAMGDVLHREETVEDVTEQFYDLQTRLRNARAMRARLEKLLEQAVNVKDALEVERELGRITADIDVMEGKLKLLGELVAFSTITVEFRPRDVDRVDSKVKLPFPWLDRLGLPHLMNL